MVWTWQFVRDTPSWVQNREHLQRLKRSARPQILSDPNILSGKRGIQGQEEGRCFAWKSLVLMLKIETLLKLVISRKFNFEVKRMKPPT